MHIVRADRPRDEVKLSQDEVTDAINDYVFKHTGRRVAGLVQITQVAGNSFNTTARLMHDGEDEVVDAKTDQQVIAVSDIPASLLKPSGAGEANKLIRDGE